MTAREDTALIAGQLADLTRTVQEMASQLDALRERADQEQLRADRHSGYLTAAPIPQPARLP